MKTLHEIDSTPTVLDFLNICWPTWTARYNADGDIDFVDDNGYVGNTIPGDAWDIGYRNWLDAGAPRDQNTAMNVGINEP